MRLVFFGSPRFALPTLERLIASRHSVVGVITQPDKPRGRGHVISQGPVKALAIASRIPVLQPDRLKTPEFLHACAALAADLGIVAAYGKILPEEVLRIPPLGLVNVHASLLPRWRGAAPVERAIMAGDRETGVTIMRIVRALDAGPTFAAAKRSIGADETAEQVERDLASLGAGLLLDVLDSIETGSAVETPQPESLATYAPRITREEGAIDWAQPAIAIHDKVRALHEWPHAFSLLGGTRYILLGTSPAASMSDDAPGTVVEAAGDRLAVATGDGLIHIIEIQPEGRRPMTARQFLSGYRVKPGMRFETPASQP